MENNATAVASGHSQRPLRVLAVASVENPDIALRCIDSQTVLPDAKVVYLDMKPAEGIDARRKRIAENQNHLQEVVTKVLQKEHFDIIWQVEGDSEIPYDALEKLLNHYREFPAIYSGVQVGRHGLYCLGAWHIADDRNSFESVDYQKKGLQQVDAMGFYCFIMEARAWLRAKAFWDDQRWGPDVNFFISSSQEKYVDMDLHIGHHHNGGIIEPSQVSTCNARFWKEENEWRFKQL